MNTSVSVRLSDDIVRQLEAIAKETERSRTFHIQKAIEAYLEDHADLQIALDRLRDQTDPVVSSKDMRKALGV